MIGSVIGSFLVSSRASSSSYVGTAAHSNGPSNGFYVTEAVLSVITLAGRL